MLLEKGPDGAEGAACAKKVRLALWGGVMALGGLGLHGGAQAVGINQMAVTASENAVVIDAQDAPVSQSTELTAAVINGDGYAAASATAVRLTARSTSLSTQMQHFDASATQFAAFDYWNTATQSPYAAADLAGQSLSLDMLASGEVTMPGSEWDGNARATSYVYSAVLYSGVAVGQSGGGTLACGPTGCLGTGDPLHLGTNWVDAPFTLSAPMVASGGYLSTYLLVGNGGGTSSAMSLRLLGAHVSGALAAPLALRFSDGSLYTVTSVPEPEALALALAGALLTLVARAGRAQRRA